MNRTAVRCLACSLVLFSEIAARGNQDTLPQTPEALAEAAAKSQAQDDYTSAARDYQQLLKLGIDAPELRSNLGVMLYMDGDTRGALTQLRIALKQNPALAASNLFVGLALIRLGRPGDALTYLEKARSQKPNNVEPLLALAQANVASGHLSSAKDYYLKATQLIPDSAEAWYGLGITSRSLAKQLSRQSIKPGNSASQVDAAKKDLDTAAQAMSRAVQIDPHNIKIHMLLGESFRLLNDRDESIREYETVIQTRRDFEPAYIGLANAYWQFGGIDEALPPLKKALELAPSDSEANALMAQFLLQKRQLDDARRFAQRALAGGSGQSFARVVMAKIYLAEGKPAAAVDELQQAVPDDVDGSWHYILYRTLHKLGRDREAQLALQQSRELLNSKH